MGGNGALKPGKSWTFKNIEYKVVSYITKQIVLIDKNGKNKKLPEESDAHVPGRLYAIFERNGQDVHAIACYGTNHKKRWEIHTLPHHGLTPHFHYWKDGRPVDEDPHVLTKLMERLLEKVRNFKP